MNSIMQVNDEINIEQLKGQMVVSSIEVAAHYEKRHDNLMQAINKLLATDDRCKEMFFADTYTNQNNHEYPCYYMTRDGFSMLSMGFTGAKAVQWKIRYIDAFNSMEKTIQLAHMDSYRIEDPVLRAKRWIEEKQAALATEEKLKVAAPKAETFDHVCQAKTSMNFTETAKLLGVKRSSMIDQLERHHYLYRNRHNVLFPYSNYSESGNYNYFVLKRVPYGNEWRNERGEICRNTSPQTYVTMQGVHALRRLMKKWNVKIA